MASDIVAMRRVTAYRTTDDKLHDSRDAATRHQAVIDLTAWLMLEAKLEHADADMLAEAMIEDSDTIARILRAANKGL